LRPEEIHVARPPQAGEARKGRAPLLWPEIVPDPHGLAGFTIAVGVLFCHLTQNTAGLLLSESRWVSIAAHAWLLGAPPLGLYLGVRHLLVRGDSLLPFFSVPISFLLVLFTLLGIGFSL
jgi:hypothetical protein